MDINIQHLTFNIARAPCPMPHASCLMPGEPMIKIVCTNCSKPLSLDETKLPPNKEVVFPCPVCKTKLTVDRRNFEGGTPVSEAAAPGASAPAHDPHHEGHTDDDDGFGAKALLVGND